MSKVRWAIAVQSKTVPWDMELSEAICQCFQELGYSAFLAQDGDPEGLKADVLLLTNVLGKYPVYCRKLKECGSKRPVTILWQMDPLPPEDLPPEAESAGLAACRLRDFLRLRHPAERLWWQKWLTLYRQRVWFYQQFSAPGFRKACRLVKRSHDGEFDWLLIRGVMENWQDILDARDEGWLDHIVVSTNQRRRFLTKRGIDAHFIPVGAHEYMGRDLGLPRDIPVGFLGYIKHGKRAGKLRHMGERLKKNGIPLTQTVKDCYGEQRCEWLNRTRVLVSLNKYPWNPAWIRLLMAASCGTLVVSEPMNDEHPMVEGVHYIAALPDEMPEVICKLLDDRERIERITSAAAALCRNELTLINSVEKLSRLGER